MKKNINQIFLLLGALLLLAIPVSAAEVVLDNETLYVKGVDDSIGLGAYNVVLNYDGNLSILSVEGKSGFMVAANIQNDNFQTVLAGISIEGKTGDVPIATIDKSGIGDIKITVKTLGNVKGDPIPFDNEEFGGVIYTPAPGSEVIISDLSSSGSSDDKQEVVVITQKPTEVPIQGLEGLDAEEDEVESEDDSYIPIVSARTGSVSEIADETVVSSEVLAEETKSAQTPLNLLVILISIGSIFIFVRSKYQK